MKVGLLFMFLGLCSSQPVHENANCIVMTPEKAKELDKIGEEVKEFIEELADKHEDIDFAFVELNVEGHSDDEKEDDKETTLKISVNACNMESGEKIGDNYLKNDYVDTKETEEKEESLKSREHYEKENYEKDTERDTFDDTRQDSTKEERDIKRDHRIAKKHKIRELKKQLNSEKKKAKSKDTKKRKQYNGKHSDENYSEEHKSNKMTMENHKVNTNNKKKMNRYPFSKNRVSNNDDELENDAEKGNVIKNHNYNGNYDNSNVYIYAPKFDNSQYMLGSTPDYFNSYLYDILFSKYIRDHAKTNYELQKYYEYSPEGCENCYYFPPEENEYFNAYTIDQVFRNVMTNKFKKDDQTANYYLNFGEYGTADFDKHIYTGMNRYANGCGVY